MNFKPGVLQSLTWHQPTENRRSNSQSFHFSTATISTPSSLQVGFPHFTFNFHFLFAFFHFHFPTETFYLKKKKWDFFLQALGWCYVVIPGCSWRGKETSPSSQSPSSPSSSSTSSSGSTSTSPWSGEKNTMSHKRAG